MPPSKAKIRLWGRNNSINAQKVIWTLEELKVPYERLEAGGTHGVTDTPEYEALNPNRLVPSFDIFSRHMRLKAAPAFTIPAMRGSGRWKNNGWTGRRLTSGRKCGQSSTD